jgi:hypothetical protein
MTSLWCRLGRHAWVADKNEDGERFKRCRRCSAIKDDPPDPGSSFHMATGFGG